MPKRILFWNIENFAQNKVNHNNNKRQPGTTISRYLASRLRSAYIVSHIVQTIPDIFVVVEIETGYDAPGRLVRGAGMNGAITLLNDIRNGTGNNNWMLVPPLQTGPNEGVAVYYDSTDLIFTGPYIWPGGGGATAQPAGGMAGAYPPAITAVVGGGVVPANALQNIGVNENQCAACVDFTYNANNAANQGNPIVYAGRAPYMVTFAEMNNAVMPPVLTRNITVFGVHSPASYPFAAAYLQELADTEEITVANAANEVRVVAGDFNVNLMTATLFPNANYANMQGGLANYTLELAPIAPPPAVIPNGYQGYFATHIKPRRSAVYWSTAALASYYPGFGYIGSARVANLYAIDNIFTRYGAGVAPPLANSFTILNGISGSPFNVVAPTPGGAPPGVQGFNVALPNPIFNPAPAVAPAFSIARRQVFYSWANYGSLRSTSDHLALMMDI